MKPIFGKAFASAIRCSPPPNPISSRTSLVGGVEELGEVFRRGAADIERQLRQQFVDQVGLMLRSLWPLRRPKNERVRVRGGAVVRRPIAIADVAS